ncbi:MAG: hypothetical protein GY727_15195 [Gammaproteobacteria bacterium]|nr:hypothetical protein [Gammaproteobacteria bacterium]
MDELRLFQLLGVDKAENPAKAAAELWPRDRVQDVLGDLSGDDDVSYWQGLMQYLNDALTFHAVRPGASIDGVGISADIRITDATPKSIVFRQLPDISFHLQQTLSEPARVFVTKKDTGIDIVLEAVPVEIRLPTDLLRPLRIKGSEETGPIELMPLETFIAGQLDSFKVVLREDRYSSLFVHVRVRMTEELEFIIEPAVPLSFGPCLFLELPCQGIHDLAFLSSGSLIGEHEGELAIEWARHSLTRGQLTGSGASGFIVIRTIDIDHTNSQVAKLEKRFNTSQDEGNKVEFVIEDLAVPVFAGPLPIPTHGRFGLRRLLNTGSAEFSVVTEAFDHTSAPISINLPFDLRLKIFRLLIETPSEDNGQAVFANLAIVHVDDDQNESGHAATIDVTDDWTIHLGWQVGTDGFRIFELLNIEIRLMAVRIGMRPLGLGDPDSSLKDNFQIVFDIGLFDTEESEKAFAFKTQSGQPLRLLVRDVGYSFGGWFSPDGILGMFWLPPGATLTAFENFKWSIDEFGFVTDNNGGRYFVLSGSLPLTFLGAASGSGLRLQRLRIRYGGNPNAAPILLDGLSLAIKIGSVSISGRGSVREFNHIGHDYKEFQFGLAVAFPASGIKFEIAMQLLYGKVTGDQFNFTYWLGGLRLSGLPIGGGLELFNLRGLLAGNFVPELPPADGNTQDMRLFRWYIEDRTRLKLPDNRDLTGWKPLSDATSFGLGIGVRLSASSLVSLDSFVFATRSPEEFIFLIGLEVLIAKSEKPIGYGAFEWDLRRDKWGFTAGAALGLADLFGADLPNLWALDLVNITGTLYAGNKPGTFAIGQINDITTWLSFRFKSTKLLKADVFMGGCVHIVSREEGPKAFGIVLTAKGESDFAIGVVKLYSEFGILVGCWRNESTASGFLGWFEAGIRIKVFRVFNFGASIKIEFDCLGADPTYWRLSLEFRINTPWWMPDVTLRFHRVSEQDAQPGQMQCLSLPLAGGEIQQPGAEQTKPLLLRGFVGQPQGLESRTVYSLLSISVLTEEIVDADIDVLVPVSIDSTIALDFKNTVTDRLSIGEQSSVSSEQRSNDLIVRYELIAIGIRRREIFGTGEWTDLLAPETTQLTESDLIPGESLEVSFSSDVVLHWNRDHTFGGKHDTRQLLVNADTPYWFVTDNPEADDVSVRNDPAWPCCNIDKRLQIPFYYLDFAELPFGVRLPRSLQVPNTSTILRWQAIRTPVVAPGVVIPGLPHVARIHHIPGIIAILNFDKPAAIVAWTVAWTAAANPNKISIEGYRGLELVQIQLHSLSADSPPALHLEDGLGLDSVVLRYRGNYVDFEPLEIKQIRFTTVRQQLDRIIRLGRCREAQDHVAGGGKLGWLPNHDYEITTSIRIEVEHTRTATMETVVKQSSYFRTKGPPGLNTVERIGSEIEPYVESRYPNDLPVYRKETILLAMNERFNVLMPTEAGNSDAPAEKQQLFEWALTVERIGGPQERERLTQSDKDWLTENRTVLWVIKPRMPLVVNTGIANEKIRKASTLNVQRQRLEHIVEHSTFCHNETPILHDTWVLQHKPVDLDDPEATTPTWQAATEFRASLRRKSAPFIERDGFDVDDTTAVTGIASNGSPVIWQVTDGSMHIANANTDNNDKYAIMGESDWNHLEIKISIEDIVDRAGFAVAIEKDESGIVRALMVVVDKQVDQSTLRIIAIRDGASTELTSVNIGTVVQAQLEITAYDDRISALVGNTQISAERTDLRNGFIAMVSRSIAKFHRLSVQSLTGYRLEFISSRYQDFEEHIDSFSGDMSVLSVGELQPATRSVQQLLSDTHLDIRNVMQDRDNAEARQRLFETWIQDLGLALRESPKQLEITRVNNSSSVALLLLESPEPLPFSQDVEVILWHRKLILSTTPPDLPVEFLEVANNLDLTHDNLVATNLSQRATKILRKVHWVISTSANNNKKVFKIFKVDQSRRRRANQLRAQLLEVIQTDFFGYTTNNLISGLTHLNAGENVFLDHSGKVLGDIFLLPQFEYRVIPSRVLSNGQENHAIIIPSDHSVQAHIPLPTGRYQLEFKLDRVRYRVNNPDSESNYRANSMIYVRV